MQSPFPPPLDRPHSPCHAQPALPTASASTLYIPIASPPTPAPSPRPHNPPSFAGVFNSDYTQTPNYTHPHPPAHLSRLEFAALASSAPARRRYLAALLADCTPSELLFVSTTIAPLLKRDFLAELPPELALHILSFVDHPRTLARAAQVSHTWADLAADDALWKALADRYAFEIEPAPAPAPAPAPSAPEDRAADRFHFESDEAGERRVDTGFRSVSASSSSSWTDAIRRRAGLPSQQGTGVDALERAYAEMYTTSVPRSLFSFRKHFQREYTMMCNWRKGGRLLRSHRVPILAPDAGVITSLALDADWVVVGLASARIHVFSARTGVLARTLTGHESGVWAVHLVSRGGSWRSAPTSSGPTGGGDGAEGDEGRAPLVEEEGGDPVVPPSLRTALGLDVPRPPGPYPDAGTNGGKGKPSDIGCASEGWGQPGALVVSGGCDKLLRVWDVKSGHCIHTLRGHTSTIRCVRVLHNRPVAVTGSRDATLRVWDVQRGVPLRLLQGHTQSVRCLDACGARVVSGSYDTTCRVWDADTGACLHVLRGHQHQIYSVAFDGVRIASGGMDTTVRIWDAQSGQCTALLQGHTALVCQLQLCPSAGLLATGGADGRVITFALDTYAARSRLAAHDSSVTALQLDARFLVTGGNDGRVRLYETATGRHVRDLTEGCESVWKVAHNGAGTCAVMCKRAGKTVMEVWSYRPRE